MATNWFDKNEIEPHVEDAIYQPLTESNQMIEIAHMITTRADFMLVPSRFEPCSLIQLHAMHYDTTSIVASIGGLVDTMQEGITGFQMGDFHVDCEEVDPDDVTAITTTVKRALKMYGTPSFTTMGQNCMGQDFSWKGPLR